ncbi:rod shape-determining protein MreC [Flocculibacter collagenilyticus]|uniref:rod shape-determining protein MreC n=1 Tax=Flocculibacter collagenilyticus TaxID=2744479 RepID=UPI0018F5FB9A|nr:rod shape-determining protein MreC [Flocculibacter collagenilyticus]
MDPIFGRGPSLQLRLLIAIVFSIVLMFADHFTNSSATIRTYLNSLVSPLIYMASLPQQMLDWSAQQVMTRDQLMSENNQLRERILTQNEQLQRFKFLQNENEKLRALLSSPVRTDVKKLSAEVLAVHSDRFSHQVVINRGSTNGVYEGQPVIDDSGIVGQVLYVGTTTSRVLLISDTTHAIPVRIQRNDIRTTVEGIGKLRQLKLSHVPHSTDIKVGDKLVTSGLGNRFPQGYPVAKVTFINRDESLPFTQIYAEPEALLDRVRYVLLLWPERKEQVSQ